MAFPFYCILYHSSSTGYPAPGTACYKQTNKEYSTRYEYCTVLYGTGYRVPGIYSTVLYYLLRQTLDTTTRRLYDGHAGAVVV